MTMRNVLLSLSLALLVPAMTGPAAAQDDAAEVDPRYVWDLTDLWPDLESWNRSRLDVIERAPRIEARKGTLGDSAEALYEALQLVSDTIRQADRVTAYAYLELDEDLRDSEAQERYQLADAMNARVVEAMSWIDPELIEVDRERIERFLSAEPRLEPYAHGLDDVLRSAEYTLSAEAEATLSYFARTISAPSDVYSLLSNSDIPFPTIRLSDGSEHRIDNQAYGALRSSSNRDDRKAVFDAYWGTWEEFQSSVGAVLGTHIQTQIALSRARGYGSVLERELFEDNLPPEVYRTLVREVNAALPTLHRYFRLRARMLGVDQMHYYDIYPPLVELDREFDIETTKRITLDAMEILGDDWVDMQRDAIEQRWMHVYPQRGKSSGAYMLGAIYDVHPYLLLNHQDNYDSLSTFAHEWGHAMHTLYARQTQPYQTADYATFIAEIPSTSLELILEEYMVERAESVDEKLFYLGSGLESLRGTFYRQTMFAEFELALYETAERGEALTGARISEIYSDLVRRYHAHDDGVVIVDDLYTNEWMFVPHFYRNMYVFQYSTSLTAGTALYANIVDEGESGVENYKNLLRAGGSDYPYNLLVDAGVDLATPGPYRAVVDRMNAIMDEMESLLAQKEGGTSD
ncbi:MAG TPA: oligoendopeptidase F [Gammaproteobacteria bacterium]|nr:oligoendopeptidase F [Gammaproteobacteria bacterium]